MKAALEDLIVEHEYVAVCIPAKLPIKTANTLENSLWHSRKLGSPKYYVEPTPEEKASKPPAFQKLVQVGPDGRKLLYLAAHAKRIMGMTEKDSQELIWYLIRHCSQPEFSFELEWHNSGDLVW